MTVGREPQTWRYEIRVQGPLDEDWSDWFHGLTIAREGTESVLLGRVPDQAALRGILARVWDLGLTLVSVARLGNDTEEK